MKDLRWDRRFWRYRFNKWLVQTFLRIFARRFVVLHNAAFDTTVRLRVGNMQLITHGCKFNAPPGHIKISVVGGADGPMGQGIKP